MGKSQMKAFMQEINLYTKSLIEEIKTTDGKFRHNNLTHTKCPACGKYMLEVNGKHGKMLVCQDRECGHRETIARHRTPAVLSATKKWIWLAEETASNL